MYPVQNPGDWPRPVVIVYNLRGNPREQAVMQTVLTRAGFTVYRNATQLGFPELQRQDYIDALRYLFTHKVTGWWLQGHDLVTYSICTRENFAAAEKQR